MREGETWDVGDVVQIDPAHDERFGGCFLLVTEAKSFGAVGFVQVPGQGQAFFRLPYEGGERIGQAEWISQESA